MKKYLLILCLCVVFLLGFSVYQYGLFYDGKLHVVFCDVGQGDAVLLKTPSNNILLYDAGPDGEVLSCLSDNLPFWQKTVDVFILSHPHADHFMGLFSVLTDYTVKSYVSETLVNRSVGYTELQKELSQQALDPQLLGKGDRITLSEGIMLEILGPSTSFLQRTSPNGTIGESGEFASLIVKLSYKDFSVLLTGDSQVSGLEDAKGEPVTLLHVPHHGSKTGLNDEVLRSLRPELAVISVGRNTYGHPSNTILKLLKNAGIETLRTDERGDIKIITDGSRYSVLSEK